MRTPQAASRTHRYIGIFLLSAGLTLSACATSSAPPTDPTEEAFKRGQRAITTGVEEASQESEGVEELVVRTRQNACQCDAPAAEIYIHGRWTRVYLEGDEAVLERVKKSAAIAEREVRIDTIWVRGALSDETRPSERGIAYPIFEIRALR